MPRFLYFAAPAPQRCAALICNIYNKAAPYEKFEVSTTYSDRWEVKTNGAKSSSQTVSLPFIYYDNESLMVILGAVSYEAGKTYKLNDTVLLTAGISMLKVKYEGTETIAVSLWQGRVLQSVLWRNNTLVFR